MADVGLHRADLAAVRPRTTESLGQGGDLHRVTECGGGAVCLDVTDVRGADARSPVCSAHDLDLTVDTRRGEADLRRTVVVDRAAPDHREDPVAVTHRVVEPFHHDHSGTVAEYGARRVVVECAAVPVRGRDHPVLMQISDLVGHPDRHTAGQRDLTFAARDGLTSQMYRDQRGGARALHRDRRSVQIQTVGEGGRQEVGFVADLDLIVLGGR